ncbi:MAG TPA: glycosyltransferase family 39 protein [Patescibacteria group bacterium]|nr:glycosyltransferase family 39 protein [Patescibacteria group bacterium]
MKTRYKKLFINYKYEIILFVTFIFLRFFELYGRGFVGWDQTDSAWATYRILTQNFFTLQGVPIKGNAGMYLGPLYYYLITPFYFITRMDMSASLFFAGVVSIVSVVIFFYITKQLFDKQTALVSTVIYTFSVGVVAADRIQAAYILIPIISFAFFYCLYRFLTGNEKYLLYAAIVIGFGFHAHFTTVFYLIILLLTLPFFPRTKRTLQYGLYSLLAFAVFTFPLWIPLLFKHAGSNSILSYLSSSNHGFHLVRLWQLRNDAFISFQNIFQLPVLRPLVFLLIPLFAYVLKKSKSEKIIFIYLTVLWVIIPWIAFSMYNGEITDYYFSLPRNLGFMMMGVILVALFKSKNQIIKYFPALLLVVYAAYNLYLFNGLPKGNYLSVTENAKYNLAAHKKLKFIDRDPNYYTYYIYSLRKK